MIVHSYDGSDLTAPATVRLMDETPGFTARAVGAEAVVIKVTVDDDSNALDFVGWKTWRIRETDLPEGSRVIWAGFVGEQCIYGAIGDGRRWELELHECNDFIRRRLLRTGAKRPAESVSTRIAWLLTTLGFTGGLIVDHGLVEASSVTVDEHDYTGATGDSVLNDCAVACGFTPFIRYREASDDYELIFLDFLRSGQDPSSLRISNDPDDIDYTAVWPPSHDAKLKRNPERQASGIGMPYTGGFHYDQRSATQAVIGDVDLLAPAADVKTAGTAASTVTRLLAQQADQEELITDLTIRLPAENLNDVLHGQRIEAKFADFPGWSDFRACRVVTKTIRRPPNLPQDQYDVDLELVPCADQTASGIQITSPNDELCGGSYEGGGLVRIGWCDDGDAPRSGATPYPKFGLFSYVGSADARTGIQCDGTGLVDLRLAFSVSLVVDGDHTFTATIRRNGSVIATAQQVSSGGLRSQAWEIGGAAGVGTELTVSDVAVHSGDIIEAYCETSAGTPVDALPTGVGNIAHWLWATGSLAA